MVPSAITIANDRGWPSGILPRVLSKNASDFLGIHASSEWVDVKFELREDNTLYNNGLVINPWQGLEMFFPVGII
ncbi:MAG: hypothetical protein A2288_02930 [Candidatus Moranbacteria bacterium RIFOXYA12_FULL_44_15]|nr:MAG: hypothetical protein A2288_02930 [Candidatus Moranbacteria bacterium RIFOXYA12_FULL_44_15]